MIISNFLYFAVANLFGNFYSLVAMHDYDCFTRRAVFRNVDKRSRQENNWEDSNSKVIQKASSVTIDFECPAKPFHILQLSGR